MTTPLTDKDLLNLTPEQAAEIYAQGPGAVTWALLKLSVLAKAKAAAEAAGEVSKPSSQIAPYEKPAAKKGAKKRGQKAGHKGEHRRPPLQINRYEDHTLACCPDCGGPVGPSCDERQRVIEDIEKSTVVTTEHTIHSHYCPRCKKRVEPRVTDALPKSTITDGFAILRATAPWFSPVGFTTDPDKPPRRSFPFSIRCFIFPSARAGFPCNGNVSRRFSNRGTTTTAPSGKFARR